MTDADRTDKAEERENMYIMSLHSNHCKIMGFL